MAEKEEKITIYDEDGNETLCNILFTYESERTGKTFVVFYDPSKVDEDEDEMIDLEVYFYEPKDGESGELKPITEDEDWDEIEEVIEAWENENIEDDCECGCGCGCEEDEEEQDECECGCCHHHE